MAALTGELLPSAGVLFAVSRGVPDACDATTKEIPR
jgi:hypothetical protein